MGRRGNKFLHQELFAALSVLLGISKFGLRDTDLGSRLLKLCQHIAALKPGDDLAGLDHRALSHPQPLQAACGF